MDEATIIGEAADRSLVNCHGDTAEFFIRNDFPVFKGHFPGNPLLPGVVQVELCLLAASKLRGCPLRLKHLAKAKFSHPVQPDTKLTINIKSDADRYTFAISNADGAPVARIQLTVEPL